MSARRRVGVIGAGPSGLAVIKELRERGHDVVAYEAQDDLGGVFRRSSGSLTLTTSNLAVAFGAYPPVPGDGATMWTRNEYLDYLGNYAARFGLIPHVRFSTRVEALYRSGGTAGRWIIESTSRDAAKPQRNEFDHVAICSGVNSRPALPGFRGEGRFQGQILHSADFTSAEHFRGQRVLIVGLGESGSDVALEVARVASTSAVSTRRGPGYVIPRYLGGRVSDLDTNRCYHAIPRTLAGSRPLRWKARLEARYRSPLDDPGVLDEARRLNDERGLPWQRRFGTKNTAFIEAMIHHGTLYKPGVERLESDHAVFSDGSTFPCDAIIYCTGFGVGFPFLAPKHPQLAAAASSPRNLFKHTFHPDCGDGLAWVGFVRPGIGSIPPCAEMQARYLALVLGGERSLPSPSEMRVDIELEKRLDLAATTQRSRRCPMLQPAKGARSLAP